MAEDELITLSKEGGFAARHVLTSKSGVAVHINAFNFPCWGMLEKLAPRGLPGCRDHQTRYRHRAGDAGDGESDRGSGLVPDGAISLIGGAGDLLDHLDSRMW